MIVNEISLYIDHGIWLWKIVIYIYTCPHDQDPYVALYFVHIAADIMPGVNGVRGPLHGIPWRRPSVWDGGICRDLWIGWGWMVTSGMVTRGFFILKWLILMSFKNRMIKNHWMIFVMILFVVLVLRWFWLCWSSCQLSCCSWFLNCFTVMTMMMMIIIRICLFSSCSSSSLATFSSS